MPYRSLLVLLLILSSCGYRAGYGGIAAGHRTVSVPYVKGDVSGIVTNALIKQFSRSGGLRYSQCDADLILNVKIIRVCEENIGFRYDRKKSGRRTKTIVPAETRIFTIADIEVIEAVNCCRILGPVRIRASVDFDHDYYDSRGGINVFSLGQFSDYDEAYDAAKNPLSEALAKKIVDYVNNTW